MFSGEPTKWDRSESSKAINQFQVNTKEEGISGCVGGTKGERTKRADLLRKASVP